MSLCAQNLFEQAERFRLRMEVSEAARLYLLAEEAGFDPDQCGAARWTCYMLAGEWARAWAESDAIAQRGAPDPHRYWDGSSWEGKHVLLRCLHGLGDTIQFIRYAPLLRTSARSLTVEAQPKLKVLLQGSQLADRVITWGEAEPPWDMQMEVNELPRVFRSLPDSIPNRVPYIKGPHFQNRNTGEAGRLSKTGLRVGLVWEASSFDPARNIPPEMLAPLLQQSHVTFFSLQAGPSWDVALPPHVVRLGGPDPDVLPTAGNMSTLDLVITVDTMVAHLAGALGLQTWTMLPFQCDWRWMDKGSWTPWYPTMRLFRQSIRGDWTAVLQEVTAALGNGIATIKK